MRKIAFVLAHPDDAEIWCGGLLLEERIKLSEIKIYYLYTCTNERIEESNKNAKQYGYEVHYMEQNKDKLFNYLLDFNPNLIITHWEYDTNFEHRETNKYLNSIIPDLIFTNKMNFKLYCCEPVNLLGINNNIFSPDCYIDISNNYEEKIKMIDNYISQNPEYWKKTINIQNKLLGNISNCNYCEGYQQLPILGVKRCAKTIIE